MCEDHKSPVNQQDKDSLSLLLFSFKLLNLTPNSLAVVVFSLKHLDTDTIYTSARKVPLAEGINECYNKQHLPSGNVERSQPSSFKAITSIWPWMIFSE